MELSLERPWDHSKKRATHASRARHVDVDQSGVSTHTMEDTLGSSVCALSANTEVLLTQSWASA